MHQLSFGHLLVAPAGGHEHASSHAHAAAQAQSAVAHGATRLPTHDATTAPMPPQMLPTAAHDLDSSYSAGARSRHSPGSPCRPLVMITGDAPQVAHAIAAELDIDIDKVFAGVRPEDKGSKVTELQQQGRRVAMVGEGVNDAPALASADVGIAIGAGTDVALASADLVLASDDPRSVLSVPQLSRASYHKMQQDLGWAAGYNLVSVPLAAGVLAPIGFVLPMAVGALLMSASTIDVAANAQLLRRLDLRPATSTRAILESH